MKAAIIFSLSLLAASAEAQTRVLGFTKSGAAVVYVQPSVSEASEGSTELVVRDLRTGRRTSFPIEGTGPEDMPIESMSERIAAWIKQNPLVKARSSRTSPDGKSKAEVEISEAGKSGTWTGQAWSSSAGASWSLNVRREGGPARRAAACSGGSSVEVFWSPDGKRTVWLMRVSGSNMRDPGYGEVIIGTDGAPSVAVAAPRGSSAGEKAVRTLDAAGLSVVGMTEARRSRPATVVFAAKGQEGIARKAAGLFSGASVEVMSWSSAFDVVVALGDK